MQPSNEETLRAIHEHMAGLGMPATHELGVDPELCEGFVRAMVGGPAKVTARVHLAPAIPSRRFYVLYTTGMSDLPMPPDGQPPLDHELVMLLPEEWPLGVPGGGTPILGLDGKALGTVPHVSPGVSVVHDPRAVWPNLWLRAIAQLPHVSQRRVDLGAMVSAGDELPGTRFTAFLMAPLFLQDMVETRDGRRIQLLRVFLLDPDEVETKRAIGTDAMFGRIEQTRAYADLDPNRPSLANPPKKTSWWPF